MLAAPSHESSTFMIDPRILEEATRRLASRFDPERIILFGSYARGTADDRSDVDLLVIGRFEGDRRALTVAMDRALRGLGLARDIVVMTPEEFEEDRHVPGTIARPASREGKVLYERN
jgi:predicted nucleotidyltransferase